MIEGYWEFRLQLISWWPDTAVHISMETVREAIM